MLPARAGRHACDPVSSAGKPFGLPVWTLPGARHAVHLEQPEVFAAAVRRLAAAP
jgi:pimeloyl-ACP methyl ester carboxylesterase